MQSQDIHVIAQPITDQLDQDHFLEPDIDQEVIEVFDTGEEGQDQYQTPQFSQLLSQPRTSPSYISVPEV